MYGNAIQAKTAIAESVAAYQVRNSGKRPAKIFVSDKLFCELARDYVFVFRAEAKGRCTLCGIEVELFDSERAEFYLSWEAES